jgi:hypothetical protein
LPTSAARSCALWAPRCLLRAELHRHPAPDTGAAVGRARLPAVAVAAARALLPSRRARRVERARGLRRRGHRFDTVHRGLCRHRHGAPLRASQ